MSAERSKGLTHEPGATRVSVDSGYAITGGKDGSIAMHQLQRWGPHGVTLWSRSVHSGPVSWVDLRVARSIAVSGGLDGNLFFHMLAEDCQLRLDPHLLCRLPSAIYCLALDTEGKHVVIASDSVRVVSLPTAAAPSIQVFNIPLFVAPPIISVALSPCEQFLAVASSSGDVALVDYTDAIQRSRGAAHPQSTQAEVEGASKASTAFRQVLKGVLSPTRKKDEMAALRLGWLKGSQTGSTVLGIPSAAGVLLYQLPATPSQIPPQAIAATNIKREFVRAGVISQDALRDVVFVALSPYSKRKFHALIATADGYISLFKVDDVEVTSKNRSVAEAASWTAREGRYSDASVDRRTGNLFYVTDSPSGTLIKSAIRAAQPELPAPDKLLADAAPTGGEGSQATKKKAALSEESDSEGSQEDLAAVVKDLVNNSHLPKALHEGRSRRHTRGGGGGAEHSRTIKDSARRKGFIDDEASEAEDEEEEMEEEEVFEEREDDLGAEGEEADDDMPASVRSGLEGEETLSPPAWRVHRSGAPSLAPYALQPGATAPRYDGGPCYLAFNSIGAILRSADSCQILFHDVSRPSIKLPPAEAKRVTIAALGIRGGAFAFASLPPTPDGDSELGMTRGKPCELYIRHTDVPLASDFRVAFQNGEEITALACGKNYVAVLTTYHLRLFTYGGLELVVLEPPRDVVALVGQNVPQELRETEAVLQDPLALVWLVGQQHYVRVWDIARWDEILPPTLLPTAADDSGVPAPLVWVGWSDEVDALFAVDGAGVAKKLVRSFGNSWVVMLDARLLGVPAGSFWPWGVHNDQLLFSECLNNDGNGPEASTTLPPAKRLPMRPPLLTVGGESVMKHHHQYVRLWMQTEALKKSSTFYTEDVARADRELDTATEKLFLASLEQDQLARVIDCASLFQVNKHITHVLKTTAAVQQNRVAAAAMANEIERRRKLPRKKLSTLPHGGDSAVMTDAHRELLLKRLWEREAREVEQEAQRMQQRKGGPREGGEVAGGTVPGGKAPSLVTPTTLYGPPQPPAEPTKSAMKATSTLVNSAPQPSHAPANQARPTGVTSRVDREETAGVEAKKVEFQEPPPTFARAAGVPSSVKETQDTQEVAPKAPTPQRPKNPFAVLSPADAQFPTAGTPAGLPKSKPARTVVRPVERSPQRAKPSQSLQALPRGLGLRPDITSPRPASKSPKPAAAAAETAVPLKLQFDDTPTRATNPHEVLAVPSAFVPKPAAQSQSNGAEDPFASLAEGPATDWTHVLNAVQESATSEAGAEPADGVLEALRRKRFREEEDEEALSSPAFPFA